jgi:MscS family membrane protein
MSRLTDEFQRRARTPALLLLLLAAFACAASAQIPGLPKSGGPAAQADTPADPMGRSTPRGTIVAFSRAVDRSEYSTAASYLQLEPAQVRRAAQLAATLKSLIDRELHENVGRISDEPGGDLQDGLAQDREQIGPMVIDGKNVYITLVRVPDAQSGSIWLISSETLREVPALASVADRTWIERVMPKVLLDRGLFGLSLAHWIVLVGLLLATCGGLVLISVLTAFLARQLVRDAARRRAWDAWFDATRWPAIAVLTLIIQFLTIPPLGYPLTFRVVYAQIGRVVLVVALAWLLKRALALVFAHGRSMVRGKDRASTQSLMMLAERMLQALIVIIAIISMLILLGVDSKTALAGLGVVGVALALGAQKTVENLLGGVFLLSDKALAVGDYCSIGGQSGVIEDVTLRSVRIRTLNQSLLSLPAGSLAQSGVENFATRRKFLMQTTLRLRYGTSADQLRRILEGANALFTAPKFEQGECYVRLLNFGAEAIELELFAYVLTANGEEFRALREGLLLAIASRVEEAGSALAPTRFIQLEGQAKPE